MISQFTLYANCKKGNRPSFIESGDPKAAEELYEYIIESCKAQVPVVERGRFGADMKVSLINDGRLRSFWIPENCKRPEGISWFLCQVKELLTRLVPLLERFIKAFFRVRGQVEVLEHIHGYLFLIGFISCPLDMGLQIH